MATVENDKVKRCKDCDPNKYIEGLAYRGANGFHFDSSSQIYFGDEIIPIYNSLGDPDPNRTTFNANPNSLPKEGGLKITADLVDLASDYNPVLKPKNINNKVQSGRFAGFIRGVEKSLGFWFVWDFKDGMILRGAVNESLGPVKITSSGFITTQKNQDFLYDINAESAVSYFYVSDAKNFDTRLVFNSNLGDVTSPNVIQNDKLTLGGNKVSKVGYYTVSLNSTVFSGAKDKKSNAISFSSMKSLTIKSKDSQGNDPIQVTSSPIIRVQNGSSVNYTITTNIQYPNTDAWNASVNNEGLSRLGILGLSFNSSTKTISGTVQCPNSLRVTTIPINVSNEDESSGQIYTFNLQIVSGTFNSSIPTPIVNDQNFNFEVGTAIKNSKIVNTKGTYFAISNLPSGITLNLTTGVLSGTPQNAHPTGNTFSSICAVANEKGVIDTATITFNIIPKETKKFTPSASYPTELQLYSNPAFDIQSANIDVTITKRSNDIVRFEKISTILQKLNINFSTFSQRMSGPQNITTTFGNQFNSIVPDISGQSKTLSFSNLTVSGGNERRFFVYVDRPTGTFIRYVPVRVQDPKYPRDRTKTIPLIDKSTGQPVYKIVVDRVSVPRGSTLDLNTSVDLDVLMDINAGDRSVIDSNGRICYTPPSNPGDTPTDGPASVATKRSLTLQVRDTNRLFTTQSITYTLSKNVKKKREGTTVTIPAYYSNLPTETSQFIDWGDSDFLVPDVYWSDKPLLEKERNKNNKSLQDGLDPQIEYQAIYSAPTSYQGVAIPASKIGEVALEENLPGISSPKTLSTGVRKYPNGIPKKTGIYLCKIIPKGICTFFQPRYANITETFLLYLYDNPKDVAAKNQIYSCTYQVRSGRTKRNVTVNSFLGNLDQFNSVENIIPRSTKCKATSVPSVLKDYHIFPDYAEEYANNIRASEDIGITSLTNISILDVISEGPIEGIVDYEIKPLPGNTEGMRGYEAGISVERYQGDSSLIRSVYWNETPLADQTYPNNASLNFDFIKFSYTNGDKPSLHSRLQFHKDINIKEEFFTRRLVPGENVTDILNIKQTIRENNSSQTRIIKDLNDSNTNLLIKVPKYISVTKTSGLRLPGARKIEGTSEIRRYKKSINILSKDLHGLRIHVKVSSLFKQIVDLSIFESTKAASENTISGRVDRYVQLYYLRLKRISSSISEGQRVEYVTQSISGGNYIVRPANEVDADAYQVGVDTWVLKIVGKFNQGGFVETFEWLGLEKVSDENTIGWEIEITPVHYESVDINLVSKANVDSITEIYNDKLTFPNTAAVLTNFDARFFSTIPQRAYDTRLLKVKIPSNYDPYTRTYQGSWDGTFHLGWTDNPAWCFFDMVTNNRFGLGKYFESQYVDKWTLYEISQYCDGLVKSKRSNTQGGLNIDTVQLEPRFTCNLLLSTREDAYKVLNDMASIFRGIVYYTAGLIFTSQDRPKDPIYLFNNSNVKEGEFIYSNTSKRVRRNVIMVRYNDRNNFYKPAIKYVENRKGILRHGIKEMEITAFGCTSEGQAERLGKWTLLSENSESELVSFETSLPALYLKPGDIVLIQDQNRQNKIFGGRTYQLTKDFAILDIKYDQITGFLPAIYNFKFNVLTPAGNLELGTPSGNLLMDKISNNPSSFNENINLYLRGEDQQIRQLSNEIIRRKQVQTLNFLSPIDNNNGTYKPLSELGIIIEETGTNYSGYAKINFNRDLDNIQHTLLQNTVWTIEVDPNTYNPNVSPSIKSDINNVEYLGKELEGYIETTQKFRVLDIEEIEEHRYKISALQYDVDKFAEADNI